MILLLKTNLSPGPGQAHVTMSLDESSGGPQGLALISFLPARVGAGKCKPGIEGVRLVGQKVQESQGTEV